ncbi:MAG: hypothetical protein KF777_18015 [Planctomycetaceae bacterium]|nr:hypothetical protein [Planctomycetaceae bacterium]
MKSHSIVCMDVLSMGLIGCARYNNYAYIKNLGPNPVTITANPSPIFPDLPLVIPVGEEKYLEWTDKTPTSTITAVDMTTLNSDTLVDQFIGDEKSPTELEWTGSALIDVTPARFGMQ